MYYKLSAANLKQPGWPHDYLKYSVLVADPGFDNDTLSIVRRALPNASLVAYTCMSWVYSSQPCTNCTGEKCAGQDFVFRGSVHTNVNCIKCCVFAFVC